mgnify:CR=1 FL=1
MIGPYFQGGTVLDLFGGSGGLGIEAISRGCNTLYSVDHQYEAFKTIKENFSLLKLENCFPLKMDYKKALKYLYEKGIKFDYVFLDPPYGKGLVDDILQYLVDHQMLNPQACIVVEELKEVEFKGIEGIELNKRKEYEKQLNSGAEYVKSPISGVVSYKVDGLEDVLKPTNDCFSTLNKEYLDKIDACTPCRYHAPTVLVVAYDKNNVFDYPGNERNSGIEDATIVATHLMLAAYNAEIDSCWINFFNPQEMKKALDLPENEEVVMMLDLGYGNQKEPLPNHHLKKELAETVKYL